LNEFKVTDGAVTLAYSTQVSEDFTLPNTADAVSISKLTSFVGTTVMTSNAKKVDSIYVNTAGSVATNDSTHSIYFNTNAGTFNQSGDALKVDNYFKINSSATYTIDGTSRNWFGAGILAYLGGKTIPLIRMLGGGKYYDGGTITRNYMSKGNADTLTLEAGKKFSFTTLDTTDFNGTSAAKRNFVISSSTVASAIRDTIDMVPGSTVNRNFSYMYFRLNDFRPDSMSCRTGCLDGGGNKWAKP
jgi:hypothetical protein